MTNAYFPDEVERVVEEVDAVMFGRVTDPFHVFFDKGIQAQVGSHIAKNANVYPLVWLEFPFEESMGNGIERDITCTIHILMPTEVKYTQQEREDLVFWPRLFPVYDELIKQFHLSRMFSTQSEQKIKHTRIVRPYWGGGLDHKTGTKNWFEKHIDAISLQDLQLKLRLNC